MPLHILSTRAHRREAKIVLYNLWYHHTKTSEWSKITKIQFYKYEHIVLIELYFSNFSYFSNFRPLTCFSVMIPETVIYNFALLTMSTCARNM